MARRKQRNDGYYPNWDCRPNESIEDYYDRIEDWNEAISND